jgi:hypothetical protein
MAQPAIYSHKFVTVTGTANTQLRFSFPTSDLMDLNIFFKAAGGNFASQSATVQVSTDEQNWSANIDTINLGTGAFLAKYYNINSLASGASLNPVSFPFVRITVPAIGSGRTASVEISGKVSKPYHDDGAGAIKPITTYES